VARRARRTEPRGGRALIRAIGVERVMMGSDFPWYDIDHTVARIFELPGLGETEACLIVGENAASLLRIAS
jgi:predicted TIM-barrel fold metal-dependent hydrolase